MDGGGLVRFKQIIAKGAPRRIEHNGELGACEVLRQLHDHVENTEHAPVGSPAALVSGGMAWKARYRYEEPSTRTRVGLALICKYL